MLLFETPAAVAAVATALLTLQCIVGGRFLDRIWPGVYLGPVGRRVLGALLVFALLTLGQFVGWAVLGFPYTWVLILLVVVPVFITAAASPRPTEERMESRDESGEWLDGAVLLFGALAFLLNDFGWITPLVVAAAIVALLAGFAGHLHRIAAGVSAAIVIVVGVVSSLRIRSELWWFLTDDYWMFDALISSLKSVGPFEEYSTLGHATWQYHVTAYQYAAFIEQLTNAQPMIILSRVVPVVSAVLASGAAMAFFSRYTKLGRRGQLACIVVSALTYRYTFQSPSYAIGFSLLIAVLLAWMNRHYINRLSSWMLTVPPLAAAAVATKFSNLFILAALFSSSLVADCKKFGKTDRKWFNGFSTILALFLVLFALASFANDRFSGLISASELNGFGKEFLGDFRAISSRVFRHYALGSVVVSLVVPASIAVAIAQSSSRAETDEKQLRQVTVVCIATALVFGIVSGNGDSRYFVDSATSLAAILALTLATRVRFTLTAARALIVLLFAIVGILSVAMRPLINGSSDTETALRAMTANGAGVIAIPLFVATVTVGMGRFEKTRQLFGMLLLGVIVMNFSADLVGLNRREVGTPLGSSVVEYELARGSADERGITSWLRVNTPSSSLIATNYFCDACIGDAWINEDFKEFDRGIWPLKFGWGGSNFVFPAQSERLFLLQGPRFVAGGRRLPKESEARLRLSLEFANRSSARAYDELRDRGVDYFVVDRRTATSDSWRSFGQVEFENERFSVVNLSKD